MHNGVARVDGFAFQDISNGEVIAAKGSVFYPIPFKSQPIGSAQIIRIGKPQRGETVTIIAALAALVLVQPRK